MSETITCRFCQGEREVRRGICTGCGSYAANAVDKSRKKSRVLCPKCKGHRIGPFDGSSMCRDCGCQFEALEFAFADTRPEVNAMKKGL